LEGNLHSALLASPKDSGWVGTHIKKVSQSIDPGKASITKALAVIHSPTLVGDEAKA